MTSKGSAMVLRRKTLSKERDKRLGASWGFTLLELILIIILLGILVASAAPKFLRSRDFSVEGAAAMIAADIRNAQELAMATHDDKDVVFLSGATSYTAETKDDGIFKTVTLPAGVAISGPSITFTFNPLGEPTAGGGGSVTIAGGGYSKTISVESYTGKVSIS